MSIASVDRNNNKKTAMKKLFWITLIISYASCSGNSTGKASQSTIISQTRKETTTEKVEFQKTKQTDSLIIEKKVMHEFSQQDKKDEFYICIKGKSISDGKVVFKITSHDGIEILKEEFPSYLLMDYGFIGDLNSMKDREKYMKNRIANFFDEKSFIAPAIKEDEKFDKDYSDREVWLDIKSDQTAIGFRYLMGEEDGRSISYSKKTKKVVVYFNCC